MTKAPGSLLVCALLTASAQAAPPTTWESRGPGGGGALFSPSWSPHQANEIYLSCDMSELFHTTDLGQSWTTLDWRVTQGGHASKVQFTSDPLVLYTVDYTSLAGTDWERPYKSTDGGATWKTLPGDPTGGFVYGIWADQADKNRVIVNDWCNIYFSPDGGVSFQQKYTCADNGAGALIGGVFWDGQNITLGTYDGVVVSANGGTSFALVPSNGIAAGQHIYSFAGAKVGAQTRLFALAGTSVWNGFQSYDTDPNGTVYVLDPAAPGWTPRMSGIVAGNQLYFVGAARNDIQTAYLAGKDPNISYPVVYQTSDAGQNWTNVLGCTGNTNIASGWSGYQGDRDWWFGEVAMGFDVSAVDKNRAAFSDFGFIHVTTDGGATWRQDYLDPADQNPAGAPTPTHLSYHSVGLEDTTAWAVAWADQNNMMGCYSDINGTRSTDGGVTWGFNYTGHGQNSLYRVVRAASGTLYGATSSVHDMYQSTYLQDSRIDGGKGRIISSSDLGATWQQLGGTPGGGNGNPVVWVATDPTNANRLYASVVDFASNQGGIWVSNNIQLGAAATWTRLATQPPRTEGHPFNIVVLNDGSLVVSFSGRRNAGGTFTASSGVYYSTDGGTTWADRSDPNMFYWTKDVVVDPHDATQSTWYAGVFSGWGGAPNNKGGLYKTVNKGMSWTRLTNMEGVTSLTIDPNTADTAYMTTEVQGLWYTENLNSPVITWTQTTYPFRQPDRVFYNPYDASEVWVTSFGHGLRVSSTGVTTQPWLLRNDTMTTITRGGVPDVGNILPLTVADQWQSPIVAGDFDKDPLVLGDATRPLVFYALDANGVLRLLKSTTRVAVFF